MRTWISIGFTLLVLASCKQETSQLTSEPVLNEQAETDSIMMTIDQETSCFYKRDLTCWADVWVKDKATFQAWNNDDGTIDASASWDSVYAKFSEYMKANPLDEGQSTTHPKVIRKNINARFSGDKMCFLAWDQYQYSSSNEQWDYSCENRVMEKMDGKWKILAVNAFWDYERKYKSESDFQ